MWNIILKVFYEVILGNKHFLNGPHFIYIINTFQSLIITVPYVNKATYRSILAHAAPYLNKIFP